ncbi:MAG: hypothetical protein MJ103_08710 [Saccharofermentans sp.]|nr:hypothetical protein [Saccharofermentans sp.]
MNKTDLNKLQEMNDHELLLELVKSQKEDSRGQKITAIATVAMFAAVLIALVILVPKVIVTLNSIQDMVKQTQVAVEQTQTFVQSANESLNGIDEMIANVDTLVTENTQNVADAMENFNSVDFERLNQAIDDLASIIEPLARLLGH